MISDNAFFGMVAALGTSLLGMVFTAGKVVQKVNENRREIRQHVDGGAAARKEMLDGQKALAENLKVLGVDLHNDIKDMGTKIDVHVQASHQEFVRHLEQGHQVNP